MFTFESYMDYQNQVMSQYNKRLHPGSANYDQTLFMQSVANPRDIVSCAQSFPALDNVLNDTFAAHSGDIPVAKWGIITPNSDNSVSDTFTSDDMLSSSYMSSNASLSATPETPVEQKIYSKKMTFPVDFEGQSPNPPQLNSSANSTQQVKTKYSNKKSGKDDSGREKMRCTNCDTTNTPLWRKDADRRPLCNACGLFLKLHGVMRPLSLKTDIIKKRQRTSKMSNSRSNSNSKLRRRKRRGTASELQALSKDKKTSVRETQKSCQATAEVAEETPAIKKVDFDSFMTLEEKTYSRNIDHELNYDWNSKRFSSIIPDHSIGFNQDFVLPWTGNADETKLIAVEDIALDYNFGLTDEYESFDAFPI